MAKDSLGSSYERLNGGQRQEFTRTFSYLFQDSYTRLVLNFKKENIPYKEELPEGSKARVNTAVVRTNENIPVTYLMHTAPQGWILYDVIVDGVSTLQKYKTQFAQSQQHQGLRVSPEQNARTAPGGSIAGWGPASGLPVCVLSPPAALGEGAPGG